MTLGISSFTYGWNVGVPGINSVDTWNEYDLAMKCLEYQVNLLQLGDNLNFTERTPSEHEAFKNYLNAHRLGLQIGSKGLTAGNLRRCIDLCSYYQSDLLRFVIDGQDYRPSAQTVITIIQDHLDLLLQRNVTLAIENHDRFPAKELVSIMETINSPNVGICLDCVNSIGAGEGLEHVATHLSPFTVNLHIKDYSIERLPHKMGFTVTGAPAGTGMLKLDWLMELLKPYNRCQSAILEQWVTPDSTIALTLEKEKQWADKSMEYLKRKEYFNTKSAYIL